MEKKINFKIGKMNISADLDGAKFIIAEEIKAGQDMHKLNVNISDDIKKYSCMSYTTDIETCRLIFQNMTFRSSSLSYAKLNDPMEKERVGVSEFAGNKFITCFCHLNHESVPFWIIYGKKDEGENKLMLQFKNFAAEFENSIYTDYGYVINGKKFAFKSERIGEIINGQWEENNVEAKEYDLRGIVDSVQMFDVEYVPVDSEVFTEINDGDVSIDFGKITGRKNTNINMHGYNPTVLGKQKSNPWDYENETRILCTIGGNAFDKWDFIDLRLKPEIFRDLKIILSPWDDGTLRDKVKGIVDRCSLPECIKSSIEIQDSVLKGKINI